MHNWKLIVPTYGRKEPLILQMLDKDPNLTISFAVRPELDDDNFYDELKARDRVEVIRLPYGLHELGETRQAILDYCKNNDIDYCCMFDDGMINLVDMTNDKLTISDVIEKAINKIESGKYADITAGFSMFKRYGYRNDGTSVLAPDGHIKDRDYFVAFPMQAVILNMKVVNKYNLTYKSLDEVGFEDCAFFWDVIKQGLVFAGDKYIRIDGLIPNMKKNGGSHTEAQNLEQKYDIQNKRCLNYVGNVYGVAYEKRYRSYANGLLSAIIWNLDYYYEVLCEKRELNQQIIDSQFKID